jgi:hypothetical protein
MDHWRRSGEDGTEGSAADLWRHTIDQIPSVFGRLVYMSSLRDQNTGTYEHHGLSQMFGQEATDAALRESHDQAFGKWLEFDLPRQKEDLDSYLSSFQVDKRTILATWIRLAPYRNLMPTAVRDPERRLYLTDLETLLELLRIEHDVASPDPDA